MKINYIKIFERNLQNILRDVLKIVSKEGLKLNHHLYINIDTTNKKVIIPSWLKKKYPKEITIIIQYEYRNLKVLENYFSINLSFDDISCDLKIPFNSIISFADPASNFGLQLISKEKKLEKLSDKIRIKKNKNSKKKNKIINLDNYRKN